MRPETYYCLYILSWMDQPKKDKIASILLERGVNTF